MEPAVSKTRVAAFIIRDGSILLMRRDKGGEVFYTFPGGGVEPGETVEQALIREVKEETNLDVLKSFLLFDWANDGLGSEEFKSQRELYYSVKVSEGEAIIVGVEAIRDATYGLYDLEWKPLDQIAGLSNFYPKVIKEKLLNLYPNIWNSKN